MLVYSSVPGFVAVVDVVDDVKAISTCLSLDGENDRSQSKRNLQRHGSNRGTKPQLEQVPPTKGKG